MNNTVISVLRLTLLLSFVSAASLSAGPAKLILSTNSGADTVIVTDNGSGDFDLNPGSIVFFGVSVGNWSVTGVATTKPNPSSGTAAAPKVHFDVQATSSGPATGSAALTVKFSDDDFGPTAATYTANIGGVMQPGSLTYSTQISSANNQFDGPDLFAPLSFISNPAGNRTGSLVQGAPYALTKTIVIEHTTSSTFATAINMDLEFFPLAPCGLQVTKGCFIPAVPEPFDCSGAKPITGMKVRWNGENPVWVRAWNGSVGGSNVAQSTFGPVAKNQVIPWTRTTASTPNDIFFEIFNCEAMNAACKVGTSTFHLSCSDSDMNGPEDCGKAQGNGKNNTASFINDWVFEGMAGNGRVLDCTPAQPTPSGTCSVPAGPMPNCSTVGKPTSLVFRYTGGDCGGNNPQGGKFTCSGTVDPNAPITVSNSHGYTMTPATVQPGDTFTVSASSFSSQSTFRLTNDQGTQTLSIHTSCSQPLEVGNIFGGLTLVGFNGQTGGSPISYHYKVTNTSDSTLHNVVLTDDRLGLIESGLSLEPGQTRAFNASTQLAETTENTATAYVAGASPPCAASSSLVVVTLTPNCPVWTSNTTVSSKQLKRSLSNTGSTTVTITGLNISWPASNGQLMKVKLDGDTIWDKRSEVSATSITIDSSALHSDARKRSLVPGKTRTFTLEFKNNAALPQGINYEADIFFGTGCTVRLP